MSENSSPSLTWFLKKLESRVALSREESKAVLALPNAVKAVRRREFLVRVDESRRHCCVILSGFAMRHKIAGNRGRQIFSIHMRGDPVDLHNSLLRHAGAGLPDYQFRTSSQRPSRITRLTSDFLRLVVSSL